MDTPAVAELISEFERQWRASPETADRGLLERARLALDGMLGGQSAVPADLARVALSVHARAGDRAAAAGVLARFLAQDALPPSEVAWARWHLADSLAMCSPRRCAESVETQRGTLAWLQQLPNHTRVCLAREFPFLPLDGWDTDAEPLPTGALSLWAMSDATQALCWREVGRADEWLAIFEDLMTRPRLAGDDRQERFFYIRTANYLLGRLGRADEAVAVADRIEMLAEKGPNDAFSARLRAEAHVARLQAWEQGDGAPNEVERTARELADRVDDYLRRFGHDPEHRRIAGIIADNGAWPLFRRRDHALAIPLLHRGVEATPSSPHPYLWLAASLWATGAVRTAVLPLLKAAADRTPGRDVSGSLSGFPEFDAVAQDPEFQAAAAGQ